MTEDQNETTVNDSNSPESNRKEQTGEEIKITTNAKDKPLLSNKQSDIVESLRAEVEIFHRPGIRHRERLWKEYFFEFLMIFLAVVLGFFAESLREYISDRGHVRQLGTQLIQDLKNDSSVLNNNISRETILVKKSDSLYYLLQKPLKEIDTKKLQELIMSCYNINLFQPSSGAIAAIKNELHLKQFSHSDISLYIANYETNQALLQTIEKFQEENLKEYVQGFITAHFTPANSYSSLSSIYNSSITNGDLRNITQNDLAQLSVDIVFVINYNELLAETSRQLMTKATEFIKYAKKEFE